jgi:hypothetical protein
MDFLKHNLDYVLRRSIGYVLPTYVRALFLSSLTNLFFNFFCKATYQSLLTGYNTKLPKKKKS